MEQLIALCCDIDAFCQLFAPVSVYKRRLLHTGQRHRTASARRH